MCAELYDVTYPLRPQRWCQGPPYRHPRHEFPRGAGLGVCLLEGGLEVRRLEPAVVQGILGRLRATKERKCLNIMDCLRMVSLHNII